MLRYLNDFVQKGSKTKISTGLSCAIAIRLRSEVCTHYQFINMLTIAKNCHMDRYTPGQTTYTRWESGELQLFAYHSKTRYSQKHCAGNINIAFDHHVPQNACTIILRNLAVWNTERFPNDYKKHMGVGNDQTNLGVELHRKLNVKTHPSM